MTGPEKNFADKQFKTSMIPSGFIRFTRQCVVFQLIGMAMFGVRCIDVIIQNMGSEREVPSSQEK